MVIKLTLFFAFIIRIMMDVITASNFESRGNFISASIVDCAKDGVEEFLPRAFAVLKKSANQN